jgi:dTDP-4-amino-4,6-dideoxygalactose transaminase
VTTYRIPFNRAGLGDREHQAAVGAVAAGHVSGDGPATRACEQLLQALLPALRVLLTTSCTHALEMAGLLLGIGAGDEVIVPSYTFVSTANAFALRGAVPVFADIRPDTLNLDEDQLESLISPRTRAVVPVHYAGVGCEMDAILSIAARHGIAVVEDNAHGLFGTYRGRQLGTFGRLATQSFHETKNFTCGEGGALVLNDPELVERGEILREKGTDRSRFFRGQVDKYTWVDTGSSYAPSDILAAILVAQLEQREVIQAKRRRVWELYRDGLSDWAAGHDVGLPVVPAHCEQPFHMFYLLMPSLAARTELIDRLRERSILSVFHYQALNVSQMGQRFGGRDGQCPVAEGVADRLVRLPFYNDLTPGEQDEVVSVVTTAL